MKNLIVKWTISRGRDTYGYNVITLLDNGAKYKAMGGGYDMTGAVFGQWLWANYQNKIIDKIKDRKDEFYGFSDSIHVPGKYWLDGACGLDCMIRIAKEIGLKVNKLYHKNELTNFIIEE